MFKYVQKVINGLHFLELGNIMCMNLKLIRQKVLLTINTSSYNKPLTI